MLRLLLLLLLRLLLLFLLWLLLLGILRFLCGSCWRRDFLIFLLDQTHFLFLLRGHHFRLSVNLVNEILHIHIELLGFRLHPLCLEDLFHADALIRVHLQDGQNQ